MSVGVRHRRMFVYCMLIVMLEVEICMAPMSRPRKSTRNQKPENPCAAKADLLGSRKHTRM